MKDNNINENNEKLNFENLNEFHLDSFTDSYISGGFCIFSSINNILYLIYSTESKSIIAYDLNNMQKMFEIKNAHEDYISSFKHILDQNKKKDLLMSISYDTSLSNTLKLWDVKHFQCLFSINSVYKDGFLFCALFLLEENKSPNNLYILTSNCTFDYNSEPIYKFDLEGNKIGEINNSYGLDILYLTDFYDKIKSKKYLVAGTRNNIISFDINENQIYKTYYNQNNFFHTHIIIYEDYKENNFVKMIESSTEGKIRIWDFHNVKLLHTINISNNWIYGMSLWNVDYCLIGDSYKNIKLIDINKGDKIQDLSENQTNIITIKKIKLKKYGECLVSQGYKKGGIKLWVQK